MANVFDQFENQPPILGSAPGIEITTQYRQPISSTPTTLNLDAFLDTLDPMPPNLNAFYDALDRGRIASEEREYVQQRAQSGPLPTLYNQSTGEWGEVTPEIARSFGIPVGPPRSGAERGEGGRGRELKRFKGRQRILQASNVFDQFDEPYG
jgi:hypothetical protein